MAVEVVTFSPSLISGTGAITVPWPSGHQAGDIGVVTWVTSNYNAVTTPPSGWTFVPGSPDVTGLAPYLWVMWKRATSSAEASVSLPIGTASVQCARMVILRGCLADGVPHESCGQSPPTSAMSADIPSCSGTFTFNKGARLMMAAAIISDSTAAVFSDWGGNGGLTLTELFDSGTTAAGGQALGVATVALPDGGGNKFSNVSGGKPCLMQVIWLPEGGVANSPLLEGPHAYASSNTNSVTLNIAAGRFSAGDLVIVAAYTSHTSYKTLTFSATATKIGTELNTVYKYSSDLYRSEAIAWFIATGGAQSVTVTANATPSSIYIEAFVCRAIKNATKVEHFNTSGTADSVALPALAAGNLHCHFIDYGSNAAGTGDGATAILEGFQATNQPKVDFPWGYQGKWQTRGYLTPTAHPGGTVNVVQDRSWACLSISFSGTVEPLAGGSSPALFWGNNF